MRYRFLLWMVILASSFIASAQEVYVPSSNGQIVPLTRSVIVGNKTGGATLLAAYGAKLKTSLIIDGKQSSTFLPGMSTSIYLLNPRSIPIQSWKIVPLKTKKKNRELAYLSTSAYSGSKTNIEEIPVFTRKITDEIYELKPYGDLKTGDYAIIMLNNGVPQLVYDFHVESNYPPYPSISDDVVLGEFLPSSTVSKSNDDNSQSADTPILRWYFDSDPRGARIFYRVISNVPSEVKNTNETYMTTTPLEETRALNIPGLTYENAANVVMEIKLTKRGYEDQVKRYNVRQAIDQQEISGFFELVEK